MATKKKSKKKLTRSKKTASRKAKPTEKQTKKAPVKSAKKARAPKKAGAHRSAAKKKSSKIATSGKTASVKSQSRLPLRETTSRRSGEQSGDLQGLSEIEGADSESVEELIEEGNAFEAGVIAGVEEADDDGPREVHTREVPEDDVPEEYLDED